MAGEKLERRRITRARRQRRYRRRRKAALRQERERAAFDLELIARMRQPENLPPPIQLQHLRDWHKYHVAAQLHELWRAPRRRPPGSIPAFTPRVKLIHGHSFDIANLSFDHLPERYQRENVETAEYVCSLIHERVWSTGDATYDLVEIERMSCELHDFWVSRNKEWCEPELCVSYVCNFIFRNHFLFQTKVTGFTFICLLYCFKFFTDTTSYRSMRKRKIVSLFARRWRRL